MKVTERYAQKASRPLIACDFSPPRSGDPAFAQEVASLDADFICVAYSPGKSVRLDSMVAAAIIKSHGKDAIFGLSTRDMNRLAIQMHLLGAQALNIENVLVIKGDDFNEKDLARLKEVGDYKPTELIQDIKVLNEGRDFKGLKLRAPTTFCLGATADLGRGIDREARLARRKVQAGAEFLITQSVYSPSQPMEFQERYVKEAGEPLSIPVLYGVQVPAKDGIFFGEMPDSMRRDLEKGRPGSEIALDLMHSLMDAGCDAFYVIPPIFKGGVRDYAAAQEVMAAAKRR